MAQKQSSPVSFNRKPKKLHILSKMEREKREQLERLKHSEQCYPVSNHTLSESLNRLSLTESSSQSVILPISSTQPDHSSPQNAIKPITTTSLTEVTTQQTNDENSTINFSSTHPNITPNVNNQFPNKTTTSHPPKTPQSQKTKQFFKRKMISPLQNPEVKLESDENMESISKKLTFNEPRIKFTIRPSGQPSDEVPLSTPEKRLTKRMTLQKTTNVTKYPDVQCTLKFVF